jgi:hypothetical protein
LGGGNSSGHSDQQEENTDDTDATDAARIRHRFLLVARGGEERLTCMVAGDSAGGKLRGVEPMGVAPPDDSQFTKYGVSNRLRPRTPA